jgi:hypothetical protein
MHIGAEFSKFQRLPRFYLQINLSDNFKYSKHRSQQESGSKTQGTNRVELQYVHSSQPFLNSTNLLSQNKIDHIQQNWLHYL